MISSYVSLMMTLRQHVTEIVRNPRSERSIRLANASSRPQSRLATDARRAPSQPGIAFVSDRPAGDAAPAPLT